MKKETLAAVNDQIKAEFESAYIYLSMASYMESLSFLGFAHWLYEQHNEELAHANKFRQFVLDCNGLPDQPTIERPETSDWGTPVDVFSVVLDHEKLISAKIHRLYKLALEFEDYPLQVLLHEFIAEQVEEVNVASEILDRVRLAANSSAGLLILDKELGARD